MTNEEVERYNAAQAQRNGGSAFPTWGKSTGFDGSGRVTSSRTDWAGGMTLRDWFAGQALAGTLASVEALGPFEGAADIAQQTYRMADKMLEAREAKR